eukprot:3587056-Pyramimonas_sp.AAC.1
MKHRSMVYSLMFPSALWVVGGDVISIMSRKSDRQNTGWYWYLCAAAVPESTGAFRDFGGNSA